MDENLGYSSQDEDETKFDASSQWHLAQESLSSLERDSSKLFLQYQNYHLYLIQKREPPSERRIIQATKNERLCYYRNYSSSPNKTQIACMHQKTFNVFLWQYVTNTFYKSLQHTFVNIFLSSYVPEEHLFLSKMVPLMHGPLYHNLVSGCRITKKKPVTRQEEDNYEEKGRSKLYPIIVSGIKYSFIITGLLELIAYISTTILLLDYLVGSIFLKNPWNRCPESGKYEYKVGIGRKMIINCYNVMDFGKRVKNTSVIFYKNYYYIEEYSEVLQLVQIEYFRYRSKTITRLIKLIYTCLIWGLIVFGYNQTFKKNFWKMFSIIHWCVIAIDIASFAYVMLFYIREDDHFVPSISYYLPTKLTDAFSFSDVDFLAESNTAPPVVHVLTARSTQEILPGRDSAVLILSNAICFIFRALLSYRVKQHCENLVKVPIVLPGFVANAWLYFWPMYFSTFFLGDVYTLFFLLFNFVMEIMTTAVTFQCLVETVVGEWPKLQRWLVSLILIIVAVIFAFMEPVDLPLLLAYNKSTATLLECFVLYYMYPIYRLGDDISFHYGSPPHTIRMYLLLFVPVYYLYKYYGLIKITVSSLLPVLPTKQTLVIKHALIWALSLITIPILFGFVYVTYIHILKGRRGWRSIFAPTEDWGPRDYITRQLRKGYDSRIYNSSEAPRNLSRYIIGKAESKAYRLDIRYESNRRSTVLNNDFKFESEKNV